MCESCGVDIVKTLNPLNLKTLGEKMGEEGTDGCTS